MGDPCKVVKKSIPVWVPASLRQCQRRWHPELQIVLRHCCYHFQLTFSFWQVVSFVNHSLATVYPLSANYLPVSLMTPLTFRNRRSPQKTCLWFICDEKQKCKQIGRKRWPKTFQKLMILSWPRRKRDGHMATPKIRWKYENKKFWYLRLTFYFMISLFFILSIP